MQSRYWLKPAAPVDGSFASGELDLRVRQSRLCMVLAMTLVPACVGLDLIVYPKLYRAFFCSRLLCVVAQFPLYLLLYTKHARRLARPLSYTPLLFCALAICWMIYDSEGARSGYYAGLNIVMATAILVMPYTLAESIGVCGIVIGCYLVSCVFYDLHTGEHLTHVMRALISNLYFLGMTACIAVSACHYTYVRRYKEFCLRHELDTNNRQLNSTLQKLQNTEVQLVQSEKMNALGKLSAGLLHEVNNPLNFTFMALQLAKKQVKNDPDALETINDINEGMVRIRTVISDLRAFAHPTEANNTEPFPLVDALTTALRLTAHELGNITVDQSGVQGVARGAKTQVVHVLMNLLINSAYALRKKPTELKPTITISAEVVSDRLQVKVRDNGTGVDPEHLKRLFDPFFTTKPPGEGTGLGLSICHTIVSNHDGKLNVSSEPGHWTQFEFDLPLDVPRDVPQDVSPDRLPPKLQLEAA